MRIQVHVSKLQTTTVLQKDAQFSETTNLPHFSIPKPFRQHTHGDKLESDSGVSTREYMIIQNNWLMTDSEKGKNAG